MRNRIEALLPLGSLKKRCTLGEDCGMCCRGVLEEVGM